MDCGRFERDLDVPESENLSLLELIVSAEIHKTEREHARSA